MKVKSPLVVIFSARSVFRAPLCLNAEKATQLAHAVYRVRTGPGDPGKYLNSSIVFSRKSLRMVGGPSQVLKFFERHREAARWENPTTEIY